MSVDAIHDVSLEDHQKAFTELAFLMDIFTATIDNIMGGATAPVGRMAGREMAKKLPVHLHNPSLAEAVAVMIPRMAAGFQFELTSSANVQEIIFDRCVLRDVCAMRKNTLGGPLCKLFHAYLDGIINELICRPVKSEITTCGQQCRVTVQTQ